MSSSARYGSNNTPPLPPSPLADALARGHGDMGRAGNSFEVTSDNPTPIFETVNGFAYLKDLRPGATSARFVEISGDPVYSSQLTLVASYRPTTETERQNNTLAGDASYISTSLRDFRTSISFGNGSTQTHVECDISEGVAISLPGSVVEMSIFSTFFQRNYNYGNQGPLTCQAHVATGLATRPGQVTDRVFAPFQVAVDMEDPPTLRGLLDALKSALDLRTYGAP